MDVGFVVSLQFQLDVGIISTSFIDKIPGVAGTGPGEPGKAGGLGEAQLEPVAAEALIRGVKVVTTMHRRSVKQLITTRDRT